MQSTPTNTPTHTARDTWRLRWTPYPVGWWQGTRREPRILHAKLRVVLRRMLAIPTALFRGIEWWYGETGSVLKDAQKGSGR